MNRKIQFVVIIFGLLLFNAASAQKKNAKVYYISFDKNQPITANPIKEYIQDSLSNMAKDKLSIYPKLQFQTITGIGGCFNEIGGEALLSLNPEKQKEILTNLFDTINGCGFSFCRTAIGSSDFGIDGYSYSEKAGDYEMTSFSIKRDEKFVLSYIKAALHVNPDVKIFASPWSPPAWLKESGKLVGKENNNTLIDSPQIFTAYAKYLSKYITEYAKSGVTIHRITPQNETDANTNYPSCLMPPAQMSQFILKYLSPEFKRRNISTQIWAGTYRVYGKFEALELLADANLRKSIAGIGIQYTKAPNIVDLKTLFPEVKMMHTEGICYNGDNSIVQAQKRLKEITDYLCNGVENYAYWNMILNETGKSGWNWKQNALININRTNGSITYNPDYAVMYLISKFIKKGDVRIAHYLSIDAPCIALKSPKGTYKMIVQNDENTEKIVILQLENQSIPVKIPALSMSAIELN